MKRATNTGVIRRKSQRGPIIPFEFTQPAEEYLRKQSAEENKSMVEFVEELILFRKRFKKPLGEIINGK